MDALERMRIDLAEARFYARTDPKRALPILRQAAERVCKALLSDVPMRRRERDLQKLIETAGSSGRLDALARTYLEAIQGFGNFGSHDQDGAAVDPRDVALCVEHFERLVVWFARRTGVAADPLAGVDEYEERLRLDLVRRAHPTSSPDRIYPRPRADRIFGRDAELARFAAMLDEAREGSSSVFLLRGEAGIGKTRLLTEFARIAQLEGAGLFRGRVGERGQRAVFELARSLFADIFKVEPGERGTSVATKVEGVLATLDGWDDAAGFFLEFLGVRAAATSSDARPADRATILGQTTDLLLALARHAPLVLLLEDLHWADANSLELIEVLVERAVLGSMPVVLCASMRDLEAHRNAALDRARRNIGTSGCVAVDHALAPLDGEACDALLTARFPELDERVREIVRARASGVPLYVEQFAEHLRDAPEGADLQATPRRIEDLWRRRLDLLGDDEREVLTGAAVIGEDFAGALLRDALQREVDVALDTLHAQGWICPLGAIPAARYRFAHALLQNAAYVSLAPDRRRFLHGRVADALAPASQELPGATALVAEHAWRAGDFDRALRYAVRAAHEARVSFATDAALAQYRLVESARAKRPTAWSALTAQEQVEHLLGYASASHVGADDEVSVRCLAEASRLCALHRMRSERMRVAHLAAIVAKARDLDSARAGFRQCLAIAEELGDPYTTADCWLQIADIAWVYGEMDENLHGCERARAAVAEVATPRGAYYRAHARSAFGYRAFQIGDLATARSDFDAVLAYAEAAHDRLLVREMSSFLGIVAWMGGDGDTAERLHRRALEIARGVGYRCEVGTDLGNLALARELRGERPEARVLFEQARAIFASAGYTLGDTFVAFNLAVMDAEDGAHGPALAIIETCLAVFRAHRAVAAIALAELAAATLLAETGRFDEARALTASAAGASAAVTYPLGSAWAHCADAAVAARTGESALARACFERAAKDFATLDARGLAARCASAAENVAMSTDAPILLPRMQLYSLELSIFAHDR